MRLKEEIKYMSSNQCKGGSILIFEQQTTLYVESF